VEGSLPLGFAVKADGNLRLYKSDELRRLVHQQAAFAGSQRKLLYFVMLTVFVALETAQLYLEGAVNQIVATVHNAWRQVSESD
jgi:hypothetical protein